MLLSDLTTVHYIQLETQIKNILVVNESEVLDDIARSVNVSLCGTFMYSLRSDVEELPPRCKR